MAFWQRPDIFKDNKMDYTATSIPYDTYLQALEANRYASPRMVMLNGEWNFEMYKNPSLCEDFNGLNSLNGKIEVPSNIQIKGYDAPAYISTQEYYVESIEDVKPPFAPVNDNPTACYSRTFTIDNKNPDLRYYVVFDGVESGYYLYINGKYVGYSQNSFSQGTFDITDYVVSGKNTIGVKCLKYCDGSWLEDQDFFRLSGIFRDVYYYTVNKNHIKDFTCKSTLDDSYTVGKFSFSYELEGDADVSICLLDKEENVLFSQKLATKTFEFDVKNVHTWSAEKPYLYTLVIKVHNGDEVYEFRSQKIGFKRIEIVDKIILINGKRLLIKGVNRHEWHASCGRAITHEMMENDVKILKSLNINSVRTSHYINHPYFYELCNEAGLYIMDETNLETHGSWAYGQQDLVGVIPGSDPVWLDACMDRVQAMYKRDKNQPCIISWSLGNESFGGDTFIKMADYLRGEDNNRFVHYEGCSNYRATDSCSDVESLMYARPYQLIDYAKGDYTKPFILCEYSHAMGNSCGNLFEYTDCYDTYPVLQGGYIWDFCDQSIIVDGKILYGGDFDEPTRYGDFSGNGIVYGDKGLSPKAYEVKSCYQPFRMKWENGKLVIKNCNLFTSLDEYVVKFKLYNKHNTLCTKQQILSLAPLQTQAFDIGIEIPTDNETYLNVSIMKGDYEDSFAQFIFNEGKFDYTKCDAPNVGEIFEGYTYITVKNDNCYIKFHKRQGVLLSYEYKGKKIIDKGLRMNFWRTPTANDEGNKLKIKSSMWEYAGYYADAYNPRSTIYSDRAQVSIDYAISSFPVSTATITYTIYTNGSVNVKMNFNPPKEVPCIPLVGMVLQLPLEFDKADYFGNGPHECYIDRDKSVYLDNFTYNVDDTSHYLRPQENNNRTKVREVCVHNDDIGLYIVAKDEIEFKASRYYPTECNVKHDFELPTPDKTVVNINAIQMGVGGDDSWGATTHEPFLINGGKQYNLEFTLFISEYHKKK